MRNGNVMQACTYSADVEVVEESCVRHGRDMV